MSRGSGIIQRTNKVDPPVIPPAAVTGAANGLSLVGTNVELGSAGVNPLLHNTAILMGGFIFTLLNGANVQLLINPTGGSYAMGDLSAAVNGTLLNINDAIQFVEVQSSGDVMLSLDRANNLYRIGDVSGVANDTKIDVKDASSAIELDAGIGPGASLTLAGAAGAESLIINFVGSPYLSLNPVTGQYLMGDIGGAVNNTQILVDDGPQTFIVSSGPNQMLNLNMSAGTYQIGDLTPSANQTLIDIDDTVQRIFFSSGGNVNGLIIDFANSQYSIGDLGFSNSTSIIIDDAAQTIIFSGQPTGDITSGTYTPTIGLLNNVSAATPSVCQYLRVGNVVTVSGVVQIDVTGALSSTLISMSLPITGANFTGEQEGAGVAVSDGTAVTNGVPRIFAKNGGVLCRWSFISGTGTAAIDYSFTFTYQII